MVAECCKLIPDGVPRYVKFLILLVVLLCLPLLVMGVGWPIDLVVASILGADMFDCVYPTRTARLAANTCLFYLICFGFGTAITRREGDLHLDRKEFRQDFRPIDDECSCYTCKNHTRAFLNSAIGCVGFE